jgi:hypothetical protein
MSMGGSTCTWTDVQNINLPWLHPVVCWSWFSQAHKRWWCASAPKPAFTDVTISSLTSTTVGVFIPWNSQMLQAGALYLLVVKHFVSTPLIAC